MKKYGHPEFYKLLNKMAEIHSAKNHDYAGEKDVLRNLKKALDIGVPTWVGVLIRMQDKMSRLENFAIQKELKVTDEKIEDTFIDLAVYSLLASVLYKENKK